MRLWYMLIEIRDRAGIPSKWITDMFPPIFAYLNEWGLAIKHPLDFRMNWRGEFDLIRPENRRQPSKVKK